MLQCVRKRTIMSKRVTTTKNGFRVDDITFKGVRKQSAIVEELGLNEEYSEEGDVVVPVSLTPEQVTTFLNSKSENTHNMNERKLYQQLVKWVEELFDLKKKVVALEEKVATYQRVNEESIDDIIEDKAIEEDA